MLKYNGTKYAHIWIKYIRKRVPIWKVYQKIKKEFLVQFAGRQRINLEQQAKKSAE